MRKLPTNSNTVGNRRHFPKTLTDTEPGGVGYVANHAQNNMLTTSRLVPVTGTNESLTIDVASRVYGS